MEFLIDIIFLRFRRFVIRNYGKDIFIGEKKFLKKIIIMLMNECYFMGFFL